MKFLFGNIKNIVKKYKNTTIVTRHIARFKRLQDEMYKQEGIVIAVTNNKRKSLAKTNVILNFDFPEELLNKFSIFEEANIINFSNKVKIYKKRFNGINIYDYDIEFNKNKLYEFISYDEKLIDINFMKDIYEGQLYKNQGFESLRKSIIQDKVEIKYLLSNNTKY